MYVYQLLATISLDIKHVNSYATTEAFIYRLTITEN